jgi:hypothetical protein
MNPVTGLGGSSGCVAARTVVRVSGTGSDVANIGCADAAPDNEIVTTPITTERNMTTPSWFNSCFTIKSSNGHRLVNRCKPRCNMVNERFTRACNAALIAPPVKAARATQSISHLTDDWWRRLSGRIG